MNLDFLLSAVEFLGKWTYLLLFLVGTIESFVLTGIFIPGTIIIIFMGFIASLGDIKLMPIYFMTAAGAIAGDMLSYYLGKYQGKYFIEKINKIFKSDYLKVGEAFFERHGNKSVFIGRFVALIRPFIPFTAGVLGMRQDKFIFWNVLSAVLWAAIYISLGYFFGAALNSVVLWSGRAALTLLFVIIFIFASFWVRKKLKNGKKIA